jgi:hypothetical protein
MAISQEWDVGSTRGFHEQMQIELKSRLGRIFRHVRLIVFEIWAFKDTQLVDTLYLN